MQRTTISIPDELLQRLRVMAAERRTSIAALVREALEEKARSYRPRPHSLGIGASGYSDTARQNLCGACGTTPVALILDTGPLYASLDRNDADHAACRRLIERADEPLVIPAPVLVEVDYWVHVRLHPGVLVALLDDIIAGAYHVEELRPEDYRRVRELCDRYDDAHVVFVDAAVLAIVERLNEPKLVTLDQATFTCSGPVMWTRCGYSQKWRREKQRSGMVGRSIQKTELSSLPGDWWSDNAFWGSSHWCESTGI